MKSKLITLLQRRIANTAIGTSTARGMGAKGTITVARNFLATLNLSKFRKSSQKGFIRHLNYTTNHFVKNLPKGARHWGAARKFLNLFLRDVVYNKFICKKYNLSPILPWLELPLDSHVAKGLRSEPEGSSLPPWKTIIWLKPEISQKYQEIAAMVAKRRGTDRINLDLLYWRQKDN